MLSTKNKLNRHLNRFSDVQVRSVRIYSRLLFYIFISDKNFEGVPIVIIKQETRESCQCPCKDKPKDNASGSTVTLGNGASMILLDSGSLQPNSFGHTQNEQTAVNYPANTSFTYQQQPQPQLLNLSPVDQSVLSPVMTQSGVEMTGLDQHNLSVSTLNYGYSQDYPYDIASSASSVTSNGLPYSSSVGGLGTALDSMEPLFTTLTPTGDIPTTTSCCGNESILECVTLGCNSHNLEPRP